MALRRSIDNFIKNIFAPPLSGTLPEDEISLKDPGTRGEYTQQLSYESAIIAQGRVEERYPNKRLTSTFRQTTIPPSYSPSETLLSPAFGGLPLTSPAIAQGKMKAVIIGLNYSQFKRGMSPLIYATQGAWRFANILKKLGYTSENTRVVTDEEGQPIASSEYLLECIDWLIQDVSEGDRLVFTFSGYCLSPRLGHKEPYFVAADLMSIPRSIFHERLITKIPVGVELIVVLDCCNAAGMVNLKYCMGRMGNKHDTRKRDGSEVLSVLEHSGTLPTQSVLQHDLVINQPSSVASVDILLSPALRHARSTVIAPPEYFERKDGFVSPAGKVVFWAGTGAHQPAFDAYGGGVFTNAICNVFDASVDVMATNSDIWYSVVIGIGEENRRRRERDAKKAMRPPPGLRVQHAELWVSQKNPTSDRAPFIESLGPQDQTGCGNSESGSIPTQPTLITNTTPVAEVVDCLVRHNCKDITLELDLPLCSTSSFSQGGFSAIYKGYLRSGKAVAIKCIEVSGDWGSWNPKEKSLKHTAHEIYVWSQCDHPSVLRMLGFVSFGGHLLLISPWMKNGSLKDFVARNPQSNRIRLCVELATVLAYLHARGIVHGDIKAENVLVSDDGHAQLGDFGSAILSRYSSVHFTATGFKGTTRFMAPELLLGISEEQTVETDIYALGMTIFQIMTGTPPYADIPEIIIPAEVLVKRNIPIRPSFYGILYGESPKDKLWCLLTSCWDHAPESRPTAIEVKEALVELEEFTSTN
ncbi:unnamed protein product [Rhizoctonia solani]|uniref:Protein kinase domain-containing protein n=1 Tax=Rhizoctonia solani TaxID=456999 RepID=A0A8H2WFJ9_9AGAM|nr:unnamed protein product [Rhizoctonia solani]